MSVYESCELTVHVDEHASSHSRSTSDNLRLKQAIRFTSSWSYKRAFSCAVKSRLSDPPRLPSPLKESSTSLYSVLNIHFSAKCSGSDPVNPWTTYLPRIGRNLKALDFLE